MARKRMYRKGPAYMTLGSLVKDLYSDKWVYLHHRPIHPSWVKNFALTTIMGFLNHGSLSRAIKNKEED